jgi:hypothetical protein
MLLGKFCDADAPRLGLAPHAMILWRIYIMYAHVHMRVCNHIPFLARVPAAHIRCNAWYAYASCKIFKDLPKMVCHETHQEPHQKIKRKVYRARNTWILSKRFMDLGPHNVTTASVQCLPFPHCIIFFEGLQKKKKNRCTNNWFL